MEGNALCSGGLGLELYNSQRAGRGQIGGERPALVNMDGVDMVEIVGEAAAPRAPRAFQSADAVQVAAQNETRGGRQGE